MCVCVCYVFDTNFFEQETKMYAFECARGEEKDVSASCSIQNEVSRPSWTVSGSQDGVFEGGKYGPKGARRGVQSPHFGGHDKGGAEPEDQGPKRESPN